MKDVRIKGRQCCAIRLTYFQQSFERFCQRASEWFRLQFSLIYPTLFIWILKIFFQRDVFINWDINSATCIHIHSFIHSVSECTHSHFDIIYSIDDDPFNLHVSLIFFVYIYALILNLMLFKGSKLPHNYSELLSFFTNCSFTALIAL